MKNFLIETGAIFDGVNKYTVKSIDGSNLWSLEVIEKPMHNDKKWEWMVDTQFFNKEEWAKKYLKKRIQEKITGKRIIYHNPSVYSKLPGIPDICGNGSDCRYDHRGTFTMLCSDCPKADKIRAEQDGIAMIEYKLERED